MLLKRIYKERVITIKARANRKEFLTAVLSSLFFSFLFASAAIALVGMASPELLKMWLLAVGADIPKELINPKPTNWAGLVLVGVGSLGVLVWFTVAVATASIRRLHDLSLSGWWYLLFLSGTPMWSLWLGQTGLMIESVLGFMNLILMLVLAFKSGTPEANQWGYPIYD